MSTIQEALNVLTGVKPYKGGAFLACCPAHDDRTPSLIVSEKDGRIHAHCFAGCQKSAIFEAFVAKGVKIDAAANINTFVSVGDGVSFLPYTATRFVPEADYAYHDENGYLLGGVLRYKQENGSKAFCYITPHKNERGQIELKEIGFPDPRPLYGLYHLAESPEAPVIVTEGEKAADGARQLAACVGFVVTTWAGGVNAVGKTDWTPLAGRHVIIWPDNDNPGKKAAEQVKKRAEDAGALSVNIVRLPPGLPPKFDLGDSLPESLDVAKILREAAPDAKPLASKVISAFKLLEMSIPPREYIIEPFLMTSSLNMMFAPPGIGKTWLGLWMAISIAGGKPFLAYKVPRKYRVLLIDGEMLLSDIQERIRILGAEEVAHFDILPSEWLRDNPLNIQEPIDQERISQALEDLQAEGRRPDLIIFDNLSSLARGVDENDNTELDTLLRWLIELRHKGFAVLLIHHAGKSGQQRGASRREDLLDTIIKLSRLDDDETEHAEGAHFKMGFSKNRGKAPKPFELDVKLIQGRSGRLEFAHAPVTKKGGAHMKILRHIQQNNPPTQKAIAEELECTTANISTAVKILVGKGYLPKDKALTVTEDGMNALAREFPNDYEKQPAKEIPF